ncbi:hypothetical protein BDV93DRAFT_491325 [Ceratobasidium sp. AG-I]|nr:hypothetical protein BDV93DRAFT_491325 [Ceratobasidium sp. AG-I]
MSLNDLSMDARQGADVYSGVANPTSASITNDPQRDNFVSDPTSEERGAGAGPTFEGGKDAERALKPGAGVVEARPGIIADSNIAPLSAEEPGFGKCLSGAPTNSTTTSNPGVASTITGGAKLAFGTLTGNEAATEQGKEEYYGSKH